MWKRPLRSSLQIILTPSGIGKSEVSTEVLPQPNCSNGSDVFVSKEKSLCRSTYKLAPTIGSSNLELLSEVSEIKFGLKRVREAASISKAGKEVQQGLENIGDRGSWGPGDSWVTPEHSPQRQSQHMCLCSSPCQHPSASICNRAAIEGGREEPGSYGSIGENKGNNRDKSISREGKKFISLTALPTKA